MKFLRILGGFLLVAAGAFCGIYAYAAAGGMHGWNEFSLPRLFEKKNIIFAIGCPLALLLGVGIANAGSRLNFLLGALLAFAATTVGLLAAPAHTTAQAVPGLIGAGVLALASAVTAALGRRAA